METISFIKEKKLVEWILNSKFHILNKTEIIVPFCTDGKTVTHTTKLALPEKCGLEVDLVRSQDRAPGWAETHLSLRVKNIKTNWYRQWNKTIGEDVYSDDFPFVLYEFFQKTI